MAVLLFSSLNHTFEFEEVNPLVTPDRHRAHDPLLIDAPEIIDDRLMVVSFGGILASPCSPARNSNASARISGVNRSGDAWPEVRKASWSRISDIPRQRSTSN
jgi:hypothetical protein